MRAKHTGTVGLGKGSVRLEARAWRGAERGASRDCLEASRSGTRTGAGAPPASACSARCCSEFELLSKLISEANELEEGTAGITGPPSPPSPCPCPCIVLWAAPSRYCSSSIVERDGGIPLACGRSTDCSSCRIAASPAPSVAAPPAPSAELDGPVGSTPCPAATVAAPAGHRPMGGL